MTSTIVDRFDVAPEEGVKAPCRVVSTANLALSGLQTIDGVVGVANDRILVSGQTIASDRGIYLMQEGAWVRSSDWDDNTDVFSGVLISVSSGTAYQTTLWQVTFSGSFVIDSTEVEFTTIATSTSNVKVFETFPFLNVATTLSIGDTVMIKGRDTVGDGGTMTYTIVPVGTGAHDNGEYITLLGTGTQQARALFPGGVYSIRHWGAQPNGSDSAPALQSMITFLTNVVGRGKEGVIPAGVWTLRSTVTVPAAAQGVSIVTEGQTRTMLYRNTDYGDTMVLGSSSDASIESVVLDGIFFYHDYGGFENGQDPDTTLINKPTSGSHVDAWNAVRLVMRNCMAWNMPVNMTMRGGSESDIDHCSFRGVWDHAKVSGQVTTANLWLIAGSGASAGIVPTNIQLGKNGYNGYLSPSRSVTYGTFTGNISENIGPLNHIRIDAGEVVNIYGGIVTAANDANISIKPNASDICLDITIENVFFDAARLNGLHVSNGGVAGATCKFLNVIGNVFVGQFNSDNAIWIGNATGDATPSVIGGVIDSNNIGAYVKSGIVLLRSRGLSLTGNIVRDYNTRAGFLGDTLQATGLHLSAGSERTKVTGNTFGGGLDFENYDGLSTGNACSFGIAVIAGATNYHLIGNTVDQCNTPIVDFGASAATTGKRIIDNIGFNEDRAAVIPTLPATTVDHYNTLGSPAWVQIGGGTVTSIKLNNHQIAAATPHQFYIGPGDRVNITYSVAPTWSWNPL